MLYEVFWYVIWQNTLVEFCLGLQCLMMGEAFWACGQSVTVFSEKSTSRLFIHLHYLDLTDRRRTGRQSSALWTLLVESNFGFWRTEKRIHSVCISTSAHTSRHSPFWNRADAKRQLAVRRHQSNYKLIPVLGIFAISIFYFLRRACSAFADAHSAFLDSKPPVGAKNSKSFGVPHRIQLS